MAVYRTRLWFAGRAVESIPFSGVLAVPKRFLVDVHEVVARLPYAALMHAGVAGGFVLTALFIPLAGLTGIGGPLRHIDHVVALIVLGFVAGLLLVLLLRHLYARTRARIPVFAEYSTVGVAIVGLAVGSIVMVYFGLHLVLFWGVFYQVVTMLPEAFAAWVLLISTSIMAVGALLVGARRIVTSPTTLSAPLSGGLYNRLPLGLLAFAGFYGVTALPAAGLMAPILWFSLPGGLLFVVGVFGTHNVIVGAAAGPMRHAFAGVFNLAFHTRPERFDPKLGASSALIGMDLTKKKLGVETVTDFAWNRLVSFDACVQCGRCEAVCPAFAAGQPLNPKKLIFDLVLAMEGPILTRANLPGLVAMRRDCHWWVRKT